MIIDTSRFGEIEVADDLLFNFVGPILGYEHLTKYVLIDHMPDSPFKWLQSTEDKNVAFPVTVPGYFGLNYEFLIPEEEAKKLGLTSTENLLALNIVCIPQGKPQDATINLVGPIIINTDNKKSMQLVLTDTNYSVRHRLFQDNAGEIKRTTETANNKS